MKIKITITKVSSEKKRNDTKISKINNLPEKW